MASIRLEHVTLDFPIYGSVRSFRKDLLAKAGGFITRDAQSQRRLAVRSLDDVSLQIEDGDRVGLVGHNGAGKSTLLRVVARVYEPTSGKIAVEGSVSPLFNTTPGMVEDDTGFENIITCGMFLGMTREEIDGKVDSIAEFTELGEYLDLPVRTYSAGMGMRLGFGIATSLDPEILILDEGFGAGDARFTERAEKRIDALLERSSIVVIATHSDDLIRSICNKAVLMDHGKVCEFGPVEDVLRLYHELTHTRNRG